MEESIDHSSGNTRAEDFPAAVLYLNNLSKTLKSDKKKRLLYTQT